MPLASFRPCGRTGCRNLTRDTYCQEHAKDKHSYDLARGNSAERGYDSKWRRARKFYLAKHPLCIHCQRAGRTTAATVVDHIIPHKGDYKLFWDSSNWQPLCKSCHDSKTAREDGGFGNG